MSVTFPSTPQFGFHKPLCIVGIDPGVSTGVGIATLFDANGEFTPNQYHYMTATCTEPEQVWLYIRPPTRIVIVEQFSAQLISKYGIHTVEMVGGIRALCDDKGITLIRDTPQQRKPYLELARSLVPLVPHIRPNEQRHEVDALAHVVRYLYNEGHITSLKVG